MRKVFMDSTVLLRYLLNDDEEMSSIASELFEQAGNGEITLHIEPTVISECCTILSGPSYKIPRQKISNVLTRLTLLDGVTTEYPTRLAQALSWFGAHEVAFVDAYLAAGVQDDEEVVASFNPDFEQMHVKVDLLRKGKSCATD